MVAGRVTETAGEDPTEVEGVAEPAELCDRSDRLMMGGEQRSRLFETRPDHVFHGADMETTPVDRRKA